MEFLKLRFGEESLQQCDIMVKDVDESRRINSNLGTFIDAMIVSQHFWPPFQVISVVLRIIRSHIYRVTSSACILKLKD